MAAGDCILPGEVSHVSAFDIETAPSNSEKNGETTLLRVSRIGENQLFNSVAKTKLADPFFVDAYRGVQECRPAFNPHGHH